MIHHMKIACKERSDYAAIFITGGSLFINTDDHLGESITIELDADITGLIAGLQTLKRVVENEQRT